VRPVRSTFPDSMLCRPGAWSLIRTRAFAHAGHAILCVGLVLALGACSSGEPSPDSSGAGGTTGGMGSSAMSGAAGISFNLGLAAVSLDDGHALDALHLKPGDSASIVVTATPPAVHTVRFALLGTPFDAVLSDTFADTDAATGTNAITLTAPSTPTTFAVRASSPGASAATLDLAVEATNMALLAIKPSYAGERPVTSYTASAWENTTCADLTGSPPDDGPFQATTPGTWPVALQVPSDTKLAVTLRAADFAWGCTTLNAASEGVENDVEVVMTNVPMKLDMSNIDFTLDLDSFDDFDAALAEPATAVTDSVLGTATDDVEALLDAMHDLASSGTSFADARSANAWDTQVRATLGASATDALRAPLTRWMQAGMDAMPTSGGLLGTLTGSPGGAPSVTLDTVFGVPAATSGFTPTGTPSWEADANDVVLIGMSMSVAAATFLLDAATEPAMTEVSGADSLSSALAASVPCSTVADVLIANGESSRHSTTDCDAACTLQLCSDAVASLLAGALATDTPLSTLDIALKAPGSVGDDAELTSFYNGEWLGRFSTSEGSTDLTGVADGNVPPSK
jgi:hypothetical protein